jgi:hypothetical protein
MSDHKLIKSFKRVQCNLLDSYYQSFWCYDYISRVFYDHGIYFYMYYTKYVPSQKSICYRMLYLKFLDIIRKHYSFLSNTLLQGKYGSSFTSYSSPEIPSSFSNHKEILTANKRIKHDINNFPLISTNEIEKINENPQIMLQALDIMLKNTYNTNLDGDLFELALFKELITTIHWSHEDKNLLTIKFGYIIPVEQYDNMQNFINQINKHINNIHNSKKITKQEILLEIRNMNKKYRLKKRNNINYFELSSM